MRRPVLAAVLAMVVATGCSAAPAAGVPASRLAKLAKGINLSHWFAQGPRDYPVQHLKTYNQEADFRLIQSLGFRHVRWTLNEKAVCRPGGRTDLDSERLKVFDAALDAMLAAGLAVIVDLHPDDDFKRATDKDEADLVGFWRALAAHLASRDPERVFLEVMNEPTLKADRWNAVQAKVLAAMRQSAPRHTLIATGPQWSGVTNLLEVQPVDDKNVVYNFHCYDPFLFTHQGATWGWDMSRNFRNVPYPSSPEIIEGVLPDIANEQAKGHVRQYGKERWNAAKVDSVIAKAAAWGKAHAVPLTCNEFGVYRKAPADSRNRCIRDVRAACETYGIGWCMWDYAGGFSVVTGRSPNRVPDAETVEALGLTVPK